MKKEMATHSSILAWRNPWTEEPGGVQSTGSERRQDLGAKQQDGEDNRSGDGCSWREGLLIAVSKNGGHATAHRAT